MHVKQTILNGFEFINTLKVEIVEIVLLSHFLFQCYDPVSFYFLPTWAFSDGVEHCYANSYL